MTNIEHLLENALSAVDKAVDDGADAYEAFLTEMIKDHNQRMCIEAIMPIGKLWEIVQYIKFTREMWKNE